MAGQRGGLVGNLEIDLLPSSEAPGAARAALEGYLSSLPSDVVETSLLLVSELVTNSVRHAALEAGDLVKVKAQGFESSIRVEVNDAGSGFAPRRPSADLTRIGGWGLYLVEQLASRWGIVNDPSTRVWFELDLL
jgi:two-component sensor histidine kinase